MKIEKDKIYHLIAGIAIGVVAFLVVKDVAAPVIAAFTIGVAKEVLWDAALKQGTPDPVDAVATFVGGVAVGLAVQVFGFA